ncbi:MAG TPA: pyridoxine 5'-phosphate synthase, partial [Caulobacteraceae bacterium]|nr:pyridoxine 5'-phosphate synthase [Caulobacteraceae bacterium]
FEGPTHQALHDLADALQQADRRPVAGDVLEAKQAVEAGLAADAALEAHELARLTDMATFAAGLGLEVHAGHGLTFDNVAPVAALPEVRELNIGHFLIGEAIFTGLAPAIQRMRELMDEARE